jgi:hypothetical protein
MTEHKDTAGNTLRETSSGWEILQKGVGWREFIGMTVLDDGRIIDTRTAQDMQEQVIDQPQHQKQLEDDLFRHYAGIALDNVMRRVRIEAIEAIPPKMAACAADCAQAMIDELKKRGRL